MNITKSNNRILYVIIFLFSLTNCVRHKPEILPTENYDKVNNSAGVEQKPEEVNTDIVKLGMPSINKNGAYRIPEIEYHYFFGRDTVYYSEIMKFEYDESNRLVSYNQF